MSARLAGIWRHPIKSHGREQLTGTALDEGRCLPGDREWAVAHEASRFDEATKAWQPCSQFSIGAKSPRLQAIRAETQAGGRLALSHPDRPGIDLDPADPADAAAFIDWVRPLADPNRPAPARLVRGDRGMTDSDFASVSLINLASHREVEARLGRTISPLRWRGNLLVEDLPPWAEMEMVGRTLRIGTAEFRAAEPITRCRATTASTRTGERDADTLGVLNRDFGHQEMGLYLTVTRAGAIRDGDPVTLL